ncbi:uncharacterized protein LTR77_006736 [Saxophila tyrrhenica]|uniref:Transmembrane protein n=1 Tax=Saxophila tyrrhenica TaxID=1690608 RepID=A0AAV9P656_9PEZI|nr:hypothetical protein LTR77_006736 [Saxophila tyrrhenica]
MFNQTTTNATVAIHSQADLKTIRDLLNPFLSGTMGRLALVVAVCFFMVYAGLITDADTVEPDFHEHPEQPEEREDEQSSCAAGIDKDADSDFSDHAFQFHFFDHPFRTGNISNEPPANLGVIVGLRGDVDLTHCMEDLSLRPLPPGGFVENPRIRRRARLTMNMSERLRLPKDAPLAGSVLGVKLLKFSEQLKA